MKKKEKIRVGLVSPRGKFTQVWEGSSKKIAGQVRDMLRKQQNRDRPLMIINKAAEFSSG